MYIQLDYWQLRQENYTGQAWNVYYEFGLGDEWWGHNGEYADELDAWFKTLPEAREFAEQCYGDAVMEEILYNSPDRGGADKIMLGIREWYWENGSAEYDGDELFATYVKDESGSVSLSDSCLR